MSCDGIFDAAGQPRRVPSAVASEEISGGYYGGFSIELVEMTADGAVTLVRRQHISGDIDPGSRDAVLDRQCAKNQLEPSEMARFEAALAEHHFCELAPKPEERDRDQGGTTLTAHLASQSCEVHVFGSTKLEGDVKGVLEAFDSLRPRGFAWR
jgi:hypothetical protein